LAAAPDFISQKATAFYVLLRYALLLLFPHPLSYDYSFAQIPIKNLGDSEVFIAIILYLSIGIYAIIRIWKRNYAAFALLFFLLTLVPVSNMLLIIGSPMAERFMYMPSLGFCILLTLGIMKLAKPQSSEVKITDIKSMLKAGKPVFAIGLAIACLYSIKTFSRNPDWKNNLTLDSHDIKTSPNSARAHYNWALVLRETLLPEAQDSVQKKMYFEQAINEFTKATKIFSPYADAYSNLSVMYAEIGQFDKSLACSDSAVKYSPNIIGVHADKGFVLARLGRSSEAIAEFQKCIEINADFVLGYKNIGICYRNLNQPAKAIEYFNKALELEPGDVRSLNMLESAYESVGDKEKARQCKEKVRQLQSMQ